jgi:shikimate kinase/3-dehydroquinate synthase
MKRPIFVSGFMATGKSTVGQAAARLTHFPFVDLDAEVERLSGHTVPDLLREQGEAAFRAVERRAVESLLADSSPRVVALGGGSLLDRSLRLRALDHATVITLDAPLDTILSRAAAGDRPLLGHDDPATRARELLASRQDAYAEAHATLSTDGQTPEELAVSLLSLADRADLVVAAGRRSYPVQVCEGDRGVADLVAGARASQVVLVTDSTVARLLGGSFSAWAPGATVEIIEPGELSKGLDGLARLWGTLQRVRLDRRGLVLAVGGGVVTDLAGFAAATWQRGVRWLAVPTSLLGMVDAAIGGKTAIDLGEAKNVVGAFHQPIGVHVGVGLGRSEPPRGFASGLGELVKSALVGDASLLSRIERLAPQLAARVRGELSAISDADLAELVRGAARVKTRIVSRDERDGGERLKLNFGHTLGHALEAHGGFGRWAHGEAVALGMVAVLRVGERLGITPAGLAEQTARLLASLGLPSRLDRAEIAAALPWLTHDKKRDGGSVRLVLLAAPGQAIVHEIPLEQIQSLLLEVADA